MKNGLLALSMLALIGCSSIATAPEKILTHPLGTSAVHMGMSKDKVKDMWGDPDLIHNITESNEVGASVKEEWVYYGRTDVPINCGYFHKTIRISFDGDSVTRIQEEQ